MSEIKENINTIGDKKIKDSDLTPELQHHKSHVISLPNKIQKLQFEIDDLMPALNFHQNTLVATTKKEAENKIEVDEAAIKKS